ncbi:hypothetical protein [Paludisphaera borealis]|uniref:hypothetical protein n=1 Tax=Paludisphaera borealis TaxID=1387353 RepID=UPI0028527A10|nr:hypothetical protein [Paludisphaera borealis]
MATSLAAQTRAAGQPMARGGGGIRPLTLAPHAPASASSGAAASSATSATPAPMPLVADHPAAMAAPGTAMTNPGPFGYVLSGSGGSGGSSPPTTTINYSGGWSTVDSLGRYHDVIGDNATISVANPPPASGWSVASVTWNISGPASVLYDSEKIPPDTADGHFVYHVPTVLSATQNFWWGASGGLDTITANVTYVQYVYGIANYGYSSGSIQVSVAFPTTTVDVTPMAPGLRTNPSTGYKAMESGIDWHPGVASKLDDAATTFVPYELGFIQRIQSGDDTRSDSTGTNPTQNVMIIPHSGSNPAQSPRPLVDVYSAGNPFYPFFYAAGGSATGVPQSPPTQTIPTAATALNTWYDHPYLDLPVPTTPGYNDYTMNLSFVDTFMYRPLSPGGSTPAGIYVPLGAFTWSVTVEAKYTPAGGWAFNPFTTQNPTVNGTLSMPPNVITFSTGANPFWPYWVDYVGDFTSSPFWKTA